MLVGGVLGLAVGLVLAHVLGGAPGIAARLSRRAPGAPGLEPGFDADDTDGDLDGGWDAADGEREDEPDDTLGERVLEAFANDPMLAGRAIDIEAAADATIELSGRVDTEREVGYAAILAGGVPGVRRVVNRLGVER